MTALSGLVLRDGSPPSRLGERTAFAGASATTLLGGLGLLGWVTPWRWLASISPASIPMAPRTAVALVLLGATLMLDARRRSPRLTTAVSLFVFILVEDEGSLREIAREILPGMNGRALAERLVAERPALGVLYMSGYTDDVIAHRGVLEPGTLFLEKPFTALALLERVRVALGERGARESA